MAYCKKFIAGISAINFSESSAQLLKQALLSFAYKELQQELQVIKDRLARLPEKVDEQILENEQLQTYRNVLGNKQLQAYKEKQAAAVARIEFQLSLLQEEAKNPPFDLNAEVNIDDSFIQNFAANFRNIRHLADTLSDAPVAIKRLQTRLYTEILFKLEQKEQEVQLQTLSLEDIREMISQAFNLYKDESKSHLLRTQAQKLIFMGIFEIIRSGCERITVEKSFSSYTQYKEFLLLLGAKLPNVEDSNVIDNLSEYKDSHGSNISELLLDVERKLGILPEDSWNNDAKIEAFKVKKAVLHKLRFGQSDRREYVERVQSNLARDLFWGRNIRDIELFTKSGVSDDEFSALVQQHSLKQIFNKPQTLPANFSLAEKKLVAVIDEIKVKRKPTRDSKALFPIGDLRLVKGEDRLNMQKAVHAAFEKFFTPTLTVKNGLIQVDFYHSSLSSNEVTQSILEAKGLGSNSEPLVDDLKKLHRFKHEIPAIQDLTLKGRTLSEIEQSLDQYFEVVFDKQFNTIKDVALRESYKKELRDSYKKQLKNLEDTFNREEVKKISDLSLGNSEEILLRKLLELRFIAPIQGVTTGSEVSEALKKIASNQFVEAVKINNLESAVEQAYQTLASLSENDIPNYAHPILQKAKTLFTEERKEKLNTLNEILTSKDCTTDKERKLTKLFLEEYTNIAPTLGFTDYERLQNDIYGMAKETIKLLERTQNAQPALKPEEETAYFEAIQQIAKELASLNLKMHEVQFKIPYALQPNQEIIIIDKDGGEHRVKIQLNVDSLPYSLIKPPGESEFIFSFGGSRGAIAPFAGLDKAYAGEGKKKRRLFTHSRLLGVGQYGSVKEVESLLSGLNQVIKKGYVPDTEPTFSDESRNDLRTRPITARDDPFYRVESDILKNLSAAAKANNTSVGETQYWLESDKPRSKGALFTKDSTPQQYHILTGRAKGQTFADKANEALNYYTKDKLAYHDPTQRKAADLQELADMLALSQALVREAQQFATLGANKSADFGFAHNDIKPENFLYKRNSDGSFEVRYIDWATGGFEQKYEGNKKNLNDVFAELFGRDLTPQCKDGVCTDNSGRFVKKTDDAGVVYGINPTLQILHGARSGTLPYISPLVLGSERQRQTAAAGVFNPELNTVLKTNDPTLDDWALTAMTFGICNRQAYFALVKGRVVNDYIVPGILEPDGQIPLGLKIIDAKKFNEFFACGSELDSDSLKNGTAYNDPNAVMFIPSNQREGEPLHLYRRLQELKRALTPLAAEKTKDSPEQQIVDEVNEILQKVHRAVASGYGLSKKDLAKEFNAAQRCLKNYEKINDKDYQEALQKRETLQTVLNEISSGKPSKNLANELLQPVQESGLSRLYILTTYPESKEQRDNIIKVLQEAFADEAELNDKFISSEAPARHLFKEMIAQGQTDILMSLVNKIADKKSAEETLSAITSQLEKINRESLELDEKIKQTRKEFVEEEERLTQALETAKQEGERAVFEAEVLLQETRKRHAMELERLRESQKVSQEKHKELIDIQSLEFDEQIKSMLKRFEEEEKRLTQALETAKQEGERAVFEAEVLLQETRERHAIELERLRKSQKVNQENQKALQDKFDKATKMRDDFVSLVREDGLLHYAAEQGLTEIFNSLVEALKRAEVDNVLDLALAEYGPGKEQIHSAPHLKWSTHCFHIAIRNNNKKQLETLLSLLPKGNRYDEVIAKALHFCAVLGNKTLFQAILDNRLELGSPLTTEQIMAIAFPPDNLSPYHLFLSNEANLTAIDWSALKQQPELAKDFLLSAPGNPLLIAAAKTNFAGVFQLLELGQEVQFNEWQQVFSQLDSQGKNILNYMLELDQVEYLDRFVHFIKENTENSADILVRLLSNPHPVNPLKNFLSKQTNRDQHFVIVETLLDAICTDFSIATPEQQKARIVALLINKEWLIEQAKEPKNSSKLKVLLQNRALSIPFKQILFKALKEAAQETESARVFYEGLYQEVSKTPIESNKASRLEISAVFNEAIRQTTDFDMLFEALAEKQELAKKFEEDVRDLAEQVEVYKKRSEEAERQLDDELSLQQRLRKQLTETAEQLKEVSETSVRLRETIREQTEEFSRKEEELRRQVEEGKQEATDMLQKAQEEHKAAVEGFTRSLHEAEEKAKGLELDLMNKGLALEAKETSYQKLKEEFAALESLKSSLEKTLSETKEISTSEREALQRKLDEETKNREGKEAELTRLFEELHELKDINIKLHSEYEELSTAHQELAKKFEEDVRDLAEQVEVYKKRSEEAERQLDDELSLQQRLRKQLTETAEQLKEVSETSVRLRETIREQTEEFSRKEEELRRQVEEGKQEATDKLQKAQEEHKAAVEGFTRSLHEAEEKAKGLELDLMNKGLALEAKETSYQKLKEEFAALESLKSSLEKTLSETKEISTSEREALQRKLDEETKNREGKEAELTRLFEELHELKDINIKLHSEYEELSTAHQELAKKFEEDVRDLAEQVEVYKKRSEEAERQLDDELSLQQRLRKQLTETAEQLKEVSETSVRLRETIREQTEEFSRKEEELRRQVEEGKQEATDKLQKAQEEHKAAVEGFTRSLHEAEEKAKGLELDLMNKGLALEAKETSYQKLKEEFAALESLKSSLEKTLSETKEISTSEREALQRKLDEETKNREEKEAELTRLSEELQKNQEEKHSLQRQIEELKSTNGVLEKQVKDLSTIVDEYEHERDITKKQLEEEQRKSLDAERKQKEAEKIAEEALKEVAAMRLESKRLQEEMEQLRRETRERQSQLDAREHQLEERANQLNTRESLLDQRENELEERRQEVALAEEAVHYREAELVDLRAMEDPREVARRRAITALNAQLSSSIDDVLLTTISEAESNEDLAKAGLKLKYLRALYEDDFELIVDAAENRLAELQELRSETKNKLLGNNYKTLLGENREKLRNIYTNLNKIATLDSGTRKELDYLVKVSPLHWFSPAFQASLKKNAHELAPYYEKLAEGCNVIVDYLKPLSIELKHQLHSLPSTEQMLRLPENSSQRKDIEDRRALLSRYLQRIQKELDLYEPLYKLLNGDPAASNPLLRQGIRKTLHKAQDEKYVLKFLDFATDYQDFAQHEKAAHFQNDYEADSEAEATVLSGNMSSSHYRVIEAVKQGYFREHVVNPDDPLCGYFIEERAKSLDSRLDKSLKGYRPQITITISKFPQGNDHDPAVIAARVKYSLAVATQFLAEFVEPPSEENPLTLRGPNPEELRYLWTALVLVGKEVPGFQFSHKAVEVASAAFMPNKERKAAGFWGRSTQWTVNSCYNTCFKGQPSLDLWLAGLKEASKYRSNFKKESEQIKKIVGEVTHTFFGNRKAQTIIAELKQEINADPKAGG
ncbi:hypothetical protein [Legionella clemsonensis]|uniref:Chromosome partition protein Smc n=1 Tax=Legionella clemsonensis TaxID=1867846 RepID=A0A222NZA1_9GAMM|nr:hypothetical protein [Legionella clemsonensis]ASQ44885.1 Chromosome partition protein Smc [Legionella clemsonensis]